MNARPFPAALNALIAAGCIALGVAVALLLHDRPPPRNELALLRERPVVGEFLLTDQQGAPFDRARLLGHWTFAFFGYTHCPDVCPATLGTLKSVVAELGNDPGFAALGQVLFVSVDPARDTPARLDEYLDWFGPRFIGATGSDQALAQFTRMMGVVYLPPATTPAPGSDYAVDHSAAVLLIDPEGRIAAVFPAPHQREEFIARFRAVASGGAG